MELLAVQAAGNVATPISQSTPQQVWKAKNSDGSYTVALFSLDKKATMQVGLADLSIHGPASVHDLWTHQDLGKFDGQFIAAVPAHGVVLVRISANPPSTTNATSGASPHH